jgi:signal transduction histidine kinase/response regulator RpfG family c-di-GMP phosphodiesterase
MSQTILNVDDNEPARYSTSRILRRAGYFVVEAATAADAIRLATEFKPCLVILDVNLPDMSGFEVCRTLKSDPEFGSTLVLQTSATHLDNEAKVAGLDAGADSYLVQPADPEVLLATVRALIRIGQVESRLRATSAKLTAILNGITDLFLSLDPILRITDINERAAATIFEKKPEQLIGRLLPDEAVVNLSDFESELLRALREQTPIHFETSVGTSGLWFEAHAYPTADGLSVYLRDITERRQAAAERELLLAREKRAREQAEAASQAKDDFLATVSHELRSPINAILLWTSLLGSRSLDPAAATRATASIDRSARLQARLIDDLLDISRVVAGKLSIDRVEVSLATPIEAAIDNIRNDATGKDITIESDLTDEAVVVEGDPTRLQQVFSNLLSNAVKFSPPGGHIVVSMQCTPSTVTVQIADAGQGISPAFLPHVFEPFRQADSSTTRSHGGLGLGLAIVRTLVTMHGGEITAGSEGEGQGATFTVRLPRRQPRRRSEDSSSQLDDPKFLAGARILLVDDDAEFRNALATQLADWGATVTTAASAQEALQLFEKHHPDVLLSDIGMPGEDGYALIRRIRSLPSERGGNVKAAALTAYAMPHERSPVLDAGYQVHLSKPIETERLRDSLLSLLQDSDK